MSASSLGPNVLMFTVSGGVLSGTSCLQSVRNQPRRSGGENRSDGDTHTFSSQQQSLAELDKNKMHDINKCMSVLISHVDLCSFESALIPTGRWRVTLREHLQETGGSVSVPAGHGGAVRGGQANANMLMEEPL